MQSGRRGSSPDKEYNITSNQNEKSFDHVPEEGSDRSFFVYLVFIFDWAPDTHGDF